MSTLIYNSTIKQEGRYRIIDAAVEDAALELVNEITYKTPSGKEVPFRKVNYGHWELDGTCSVCRKHTLQSHGNFCCYCGADMKGDKGE